MAMPQLTTTFRPPAGGWRGHDPRVILQIGQLLQAARLVEDANTKIGRALLAAWSAVDPERPDMQPYLKLVAQLQPSERDYADAFRNLCGEQ
jgi:hypothetical protein